MDFIRIEEIFEGQFWNLKGIFIGLAGIFYSVYSHRKSNNNKVLGFKIKTDLLYTLPDFEELKIFFDEKPIQNLLVSKVLLFNEGNDVILDSDISIKKPILLKPATENVLVLKHEVLYQSNDATSVVLSNIDKGILVGFDYLNPNDGCIIQIIHSLKDNLHFPKEGDTNDTFEIEGEVKGVGGLKNLSLLESQRSHIELMILLPFMVLIIFLFLGVADYFFRRNPEFMTDNLLSATKFGVLALTFILTVCLWFLLNRYIEKKDRAKNNMIDSL